jgi:large subunit ribosomal protein L4
MKIKVYTNVGEKKEDKEIKLSLLDEPINPALIHEVVVAQLSNRRLAGAKAKSRGEVSGGGKKPFKQKGTGNARSGSSRNPIWRGGGIIFGPTGEQNYKKNISKKKRRGAIISALASKKDDILIIESVSATKTKDFAKLVEKVIGKEKGLFVYFNLAEKDILATRNIESVKVCDYRNLNVFDILNANKLVFVGEALTKAGEFLGN